MGSEPWQGPGTPHTPEVSVCQEVKEGDHSIQQVLNLRLSAQKDGA
jgi:hypothetical protein